MKKLLSALVMLFMGGTLAAENHERNLIEVAIAEGNFSYFIAALDSTGLGMIEVLETDGDFTLFIPTDEAFEALPRNELRNWTDDGAQLIDVLTFHWVTGNRTADNIRSGRLTERGSLLGDPLTFGVDDEGNILVNGTARVVKADIRASNGVIHAIDTVLVPEF